VNKPNSSPTNDSFSVQVPSPRSEALFWLGATLVLLALLIGLVFQRLTPAEPKDAAAAVQEFSAGRAIASLGRVLGDGQPHPVGSPEHARVRQRLLAELQSLGLQPEIQSSRQCDALEPDALICAYVTNLMVKLPGQVDGPALLVVAHYDSTGAGPGAADDGVGVAVLLETARAWQALGPAHSPLILLIDDGEELSLFGARAFLKHPWAKEVGAVINLEARGNAGPAILFETSTENAGVMRAFQGAAAYPSASSFAYVAYQQMPSDTDLSVFKQAGYPGINLALAQNSPVYHTPQDNLDNLSRASLQHMGDTVLSTARRMADSDLSALSTGRVVFQDLLNYGLLVLPEAAMPVMGGLALIGLLAALWKQAREGRLRLAQVGWGLLAALLMLALAALLAWGLAALLRWLSGQPVPYWANPVPLRMAVWSGALLAGALGGMLLGPRARPWGLGLGFWLLNALLGLGLGFALPGMALPFVLPALLAAILVALMAWVSRLYRPLPRFGSLAIVAAALWLPLLVFVEATLGFELAYVNGIMFGLAVGSLLPIFAAVRLDAGKAPVEDGQPLSKFSLTPARGVLAGLAAMLVIGFAWAMRTPAYSIRYPQPLNLSYLEDISRQKAYWVARPDGDLPESMAQARPFEVKGIYPWTDVQRPVLPAPTGQLPAPELEIVSDQPVEGGRLVTVRLHSPRQAAMLELWVQLDALEEVFLDGESQPILRDPQRNQLFWIQCQGLECEGMEISLKLNTSQPVPALVQDISYGLPPFGSDFLALRPMDATPVDNGDLTLVVKRIDL